MTGPEVQHRAVIDLALRNRERLNADAERLRTELAAIEGELARLDSFLVLYRGYEHGRPAPLRDRVRERLDVGEWHVLVELPPAEPAPESERSEAPDSRLSATADAGAGMLHPVRPVHAYLVLRNEQGARRIPIPSSPLRIGSGDDCDVVLPAGSGVAEEHAAVWQADERVLLHARRGASLRVSGRTVPWAYLDDGDVIEIGQISLTVSIPETWRAAS